MTTYTDSEIADIVEKIVLEQREAIGTVGNPMLACVLEGSDGRWITTEPITDMEHWLVLVALYGEERATTMRATLHASRTAGNVEHDLSGL